MTEGTHTFWQFTINNYDDTDLALLQQGYPDFVRQLVYTLEKGEEKGTPHVQAYVKLMKPQRQAYVKKLFPGASNVNYLGSDEYKLNSQRYAQKLDKTATSPATITNNPFQDPVSELMNVTRDVHANFLPTGIRSDAVARLKWKDVGYAWTSVERSNVRERPSLAKFYVSAMYQKIKEEYWREFVMNLTDAEEAERRSELRVKIPVVDKHTHTGEKFSHENGTTKHAGGGVSEGDSQGRSEHDPPSEEGSEDYEDGTGSSDEGYDEGTSDECGSDDD